MKLLDRSLVLVVLVLGLVAFANHGQAYADVNNFTITHFSANETLTRADNQGELHIDETIDVTFFDNNHGILRAIPITYKNHDLQVSDIVVSSPSGAPVQVSRSESDGNLILRIGDPSRTVTGAQQYRIKYVAHNVITFYQGHDELYWDVNGDDWQQPTLAVDYSLRLPAGLRLSDEAPRCFAGRYGATDNFCSVSRSGNVISAHAEHLMGYQTLTVVTGFQKGFFTPSTFSDWLRDHVTDILLVAMPPLLALVIGGGIWWKRGRDPRGKGTIVPEYDPPDALTPSEIGELMDFKVDNRDITACIIDLALRGYMRIIEEKQVRKFSKDKLSYQLELLKEDFTGLKNYERELLGALFTVTIIGSKTNLNDVKNKFYKTSKVFRSDVEDALAQQGYFRSAPRHYYMAAGILSGAVFGAFYLLNVLHFLGVGLILAFVVAWLFTKVMPSRTAMGVAAREKAEGLKLYISTAEKDRLAMLQSPNAPYATNAAAPIKTVELFEKLLPYAIALGVEKQWAAEFADIYTTPPNWYSGNWTAFNAMVLTNNLGGGFQQSISTAFTAPRSSGSSGFSGGGGFAGGGGGGGGGGGW